MKRFPNGIDAAPFYQHRAPDVPAGVRVESVAATDGRPQLIGGDVKTLLYTCQLAAISQDPWFSRVQSPGEPDQVALDLDPADGVSFEQVLDVARWIRDELHTLGVQAWPKTSGATGLHIFIPLAPHTPFESGLLFCQLVATLARDGEGRERALHSPAGLTRGVRALRGGHRSAPAIRAPGDREQHPGVHRPRRDRARMAGRGERAEPALPRGRDRQ